MSQLPPVHSWESYLEWKGKLMEGFYVWRTGPFGRPVCALSTDVERLAVLLGILPEGMEVLNPQMGPIV